MVSFASLNTDRVASTALSRVCKTADKGLPGLIDKSHILLILLFLYYPVVQAAALSEDVRLANLPTTSAQQLRQLASLADWQVRQAVAMNRKTPVDVLEQLARDSNQDVRIAVSTNLATTEDIFMILARDPSEQVRSVVARFEYVPASVLAVLADDNSTEIRLEVARNWNTDIPTLEKLSQDKFDEVKSMALHTLEDRKREQGAQ